MTARVDGVTVSYLRGWEARGEADAAELDALRASLDPDNPEAVEAWATALAASMEVPLGWMVEASTAPAERVATAWGYAARALLRARAEAEV